MMTKQAGIREQTWNQESKTQSDERIQPAPPKKKNTEDLTGTVILLFWLKVITDWNLIYLLSTKVDD